MPAILLVVFAVILLIIGVLSFAVYRLLRKRSRALAACAAALVALSSFLFWPFPIHGGFTFMWEVLWDNIEADLRLREAARKKKKKRDFIERFDGRFAGALDPRTVQSGRVAWSDVRGGLIWTGPFDLDGDAPGLQEAKGLCRRLEPAGYWALPTVAEHVLLWRSGGRALFRKPGRFISYMVDEDLQMEIQTSRIVRPGTGREAGQGRPALPHRTYCVARTAASPVRGYIREDIPLEDWNRYQLEALAAP